MQKTIINESPCELMFSQPVFYRVQANFNASNEVCQFDYAFKESVDRMQNESRVALFTIKPKQQVLINDLYERSTL